MVPQLWREEEEEYHGHTLNDVQGPFSAVNAPMRMQVSLIYKFKGFVDVLGFALVTWCRTARVWTRTTSFVP